MVRAVGRDGDVMGLMVRCGSCRVIPREGVKFCVFGATPISFFIFLLQNSYFHHIFKEIVCERNS